MGLLKRSSKGQSSDPSDRIRGDPAHRNAELPIAREALAEIEKSLRWSGSHSAQSLTGLPVEHSLAERNIQEPHSSGLISSQVMYHPAMASLMGRIILLNGTSSAGKSTLAQALRLELEPQFHFYSSDQLADEGFRPLDKEARLAWRQRFLMGFIGPYLLCKHRTGSLD